MSKYKLPYHFVEFASGKGHYFDHVMGLMEDLGKHIEHNRFIGSLIIAHEVGCGEGLILHQINQRLGWLCTGNDTDAEAVRMANLLVPAVKIHCYTDTIERIFNGDVIIFSDSLEHIKDWREHLEWAKKFARYVVIAVPDMHDRHGVQDFQLSSFDAIFSGWENPVKKTRSHRHVTIWKNPDKDA